MKNLILTTLAIVLLTLGCRSETPENGGTNTTPTVTAAPIDPATIKFICQSSEEPNTDADAPRHEVFLLLGSTKVKVADILNCEILGKDAYEQNQIPANALAAVGGWWAGMGDYLYVAEENGNYVVKQGSIAEESENNDFGYKTVMTFAKDGTEVF